ncbi:MAG TPA: tetratricopeptide repeat protein [Chthoniobacterales bacterium]|nr:tetratricopeptide repeat protein [Chthoniobacterales bacterium]
MNFSNFFAELKRRHVYRAAVGYCAVSWLLIQIATQVFPFFEIPNSIVRFIVVALVLGFPIAMLVAWLYELTPGGFVREEEVQPAARKAIGRKMDFIIIGVLLLVIAMLVYQRLPFRALTGETIPKKSIAVLPFENLSEDPENAFFADGIQDDILTNLAKISDLRVISRTSTERFRGQQKARGLREIAQTLGAANVLEGSVRRAGNRVAVNVQLIEARNDRQIWGQHYDRTLEDSLGLQGELSAEIADALHATLSPEEMERVTRKPTTNAEAYALYLRAFELEHRPDTLLRDYQTAVQLYGQAIALDPSFPLAHAHLASTSAAIFHFHEPLETWATKARAEAAAALRLEPNLGEGHFALGLCLYWLDENYEAALQEFAIAARLAPNETDIAALIAAIQRRQGKWEEAIASYERVEKLDPQNPNIARNLVYTSSALRRWPEASRAVKRWQQMAPDSLVAKIQAGYLEFFQGRGTGALTTLLAQIPPGTDPDGIVTACRWDVAMIQRDFNAAENTLRHCPLEAVDYLNGGSTPKSFLTGCTILARDGLRAARPILERAQSEFAAAAEAAPLIAESHANLGLVAALLGQKEEALREGRRAVELKPLAQDAVDGAIMLCDLALIEARVGENDQALALLERLMKTAGTVDTAFYSITLSDLKSRWEWDALRSDPRFKKLIANEQ